MSGFVGIAPAVALVQIFGVVNSLLQTSDAIRAAARVAPTNPCYSSLLIKSRCNNPAMISLHR
jgi:hypothetical protein